MNVIKVSLFEIRKLLVYKFQFLFSFLHPSLTLMVQVFFWDNVYSTTSNITMSKTEIIHYYFCVAFLSVLIKTQAFNIAEEFKTGAIDKELIRPVSLLKYRLFRSIGESFFTSICFFIVLPFIAILLRNFYVLSFNISKLFLFLLCSVIGFFISFFIDFLVGLCVLLIDEVWAVRAITSYALLFISGYYIPLELLPNTLKIFMKYTPFYYIMYFPSIIFVSNISLFNLLFGLSVSILWMTTLFIVTKMSIKKLIKRYSSFGG